MTEILLEFLVIGIAVGVSVTIVLRANWVRTKLKEDDEESDDRR